MGVGTNTNAIYYSISEGKICRSFKEQTANSKSRTNKQGRLVHEEFYDYVDGVITSITTKDSDFGKFWMVTLDDSGQKQILQMNYSSGYANGFLKALPNVSLGEKVKIIPSMKMEGDKKKTTVFLSQHGQAIKWYYTKENPNGLPQLEQIKVKGKLTWDDSAAMEFLQKMVDTTIVPQLGKAAPAEDLQPQEVGEDGEINTDDLPF